MRGQRSAREGGRKAFRVESTPPLGRSAGNALWKQERITVLTEERKLAGGTLSLQSHRSPNPVILEPREALLCPFDAKMRRALDELVSSLLVLAHPSAIHIHDAEIHHGIGIPTLNRS